jgi:single-strand DNA-binding protein
MGANFNFNKVILGGRLTAHPELKQTNSGVSVCQFSIAVNRKFAKEGEQQTDFLNCTAWRATAEFISKHFGKGSSICVVGSIQTRSWTDQQGQKRYATDIVVDEAMFVDSKGEAQTEPRSAAPEAQNYIPPAYSSEPVDAAAFESIGTDDDLPF